MLNWAAFRVAKGLTNHHYIWQRGGFGPVRGVIVVAVSYAGGNLGRPTGEWAGAKTYEASK